MLHAKKKSSSSRSPLKAFHLKHMIRGLESLRSNFKLRRFCTKSESLIRKEIKVRALCFLAGFYG